MKEWLWAGSKAFATALILTPILRDVFRSYNVVDRPGQRKVHVHPIPRVGGIALAIAYGAALFSFTQPGEQWSENGAAALQIIPGALLAFGIGLADDFLTLRPAYKLAGLVAAGSAVFWSGLRMNTVAGHELPVWLSYPLTIFWLLLTSNALNLIDGLDGLCAGMGLFASLTMFAAAVLHGNAALAQVTLPMVGALLGFLCYNINPATIFLGDSGALLIGFLFGCYGMMWTEKMSTALSMAVPVVALSVPLLDVLLSVARRFLRNRPIFGSDRGHIHHRLLDRGLSHGKAVGILYFSAVLAAAFALIAVSLKDPRYQGLLTVAFFIVIWTGVHQLRYTEFDVVGRVLSGGETHRTMNLRMRLDQLRRSLEAAEIEDQWWRALVDGCRALALASVRLETARGSREERLSEAAGESWTLRIPLAAGSWLDVTGSLDEGAPALELQALARAVSGTFPSGRNVRTMAASG